MEFIPGRQESTLANEGEKGGTRRHPGSYGYRIAHLPRRQSHKADGNLYASPKTYEGVIRLGETTPSYDAETEVTEQKSVDHLDDKTIREACDTFLGEITQLPPMYSAVKIGGERLYKKARRGEVVARRPRIVSVSQFDVQPRDGHDVSFVISCSKGTYIRSIAHDLGEYLGVGGHLVALRRTAIGDFTIGKAWPVEELEKQILSRGAA